MKTILPLRVRRFFAAAAACAAILSVAAAAGAQTIIEDWGTAVAPPPPAIKAAALDSKTTALLVMDFLRQNCAPQPRCIAALPAVRSLITLARAKGVLVVYTAFPGAAITDILPDVAPLGGEPYFASTADKFFNTDLDKTLKAKGIKTLIVTGMVAHGTVLNTTSDAAQHGYNVVVPVDTMPAPTAYIEQFVTFYFSSAPTVANMVTLTKSGMVSF